MFAALDSLLPGWSAPLLGVTRDGFDRVVWAVLLLGLALSTLHLLSMLITRWGDRNATSKSLIFSVLVHLSCAFGWVAMSPPSPSAPSPPDEEPAPIREIVIESEDRLEVPQRGNTPVWERLPDPLEAELARLDRPLLDPVPLAGPERRPDPVTPPEIDHPEVPSFPEDPLSMPRPEHEGRRDRLAQAAIPFNIEHPEAVPRPTVESPPPLREREPLERPDPLDLEVDRRPVRGAVDRAARDINPVRELASLETTLDPRSFLKRSAEADSVRARTGPAPAAAPDELAGAPAPDGGEGAQGGAPDRLRPSRLPSRIRDGSDAGSVERLRPMITPRTPEPDAERDVAVLDRAPVEVPDGGLTPPNVLRPNFPTVRDRRDNVLPPTYRSRGLASRRQTALEFGGSDASERAVEDSLRWLALHQGPEGSWNAGEHGAGQVEIDEHGVHRQFAGKHADTGVTALALLAFLGAGYTSEEGQYAANVDRALRWLVAQQAADGYLGGKATHYEKMYCHAMATYAIAEAYGMQSDPTLDTRLRRPLVRAVSYILDHQNPNDGGWRYAKGQAGDMSMFGWQLMALKSAEIAGIEIPRTARERMVQFLKDRSLGEQQGLAGYREGMPATPAMTAEALFCKQMLGIRRTNPASVEAAEYLLQHLPRRSQHNEYYWYYGTLAMFQYGGRGWRTWNESLRDLLVAEQVKTGDHAGSWAPRGPWGPYGGRVYATAVSTLCLEVYYRFLPLYQMGGRYDEP